MERKRISDFEIDDESKERFERRFQYLDKLNKQPGKAIYINGLEPAIFTVSTSRITSNEEEEGLRDRQRATKLFISYHRDIYLELTGRSEFIWEAFELGIINKVVASEMMSKATSIDGAVKPKKIVDGVDIMTNKESSFFGIMDDMSRGEAIDYQKSVA